MLLLGLAIFVIGILGMALGLMSTKDRFFIPGAFLAILGGMLIIASPEVKRFNPSSRASPPAALPFYILRFRITSHLSLRVPKFGRLLLL